MKRIFGLCMALLLCALPALAAENPFAPYCLTAPAAATLEVNEGTYTFVHGNTRVVALVIERVPDEAPAEAVIRLMAQFEPEAVIGADIPMAEGFVGLSAVNRDKYGEGIDQINVMVLSSDGSLLILSGHSLDGDEAQVQLLLDSLLSTLTVDGVRIVKARETPAAAQ